MELKTEPFFLVGNQRGAGFVGPRIGFLVSSALSEWKYVSRAITLPGTMHRAPLKIFEYPRDHRSMTIPDVLKASHETSNGL